MNDKGWNMNQGEIEALSYRELQIKAAGLAGWAGPRKTMVSGQVYSSSDIDFCWQSPDGQYTPCGVPDYPNDIAAAASLWDYYSKGRECYLGISYDLGQDKINPWSCAMRPEAMGIDFVYGDGPTEAIARTRAFILAMESENAN